MCIRGRGAPGTVPLHNLRVTSHVLHQDVPLEWYQLRFVYVISPCLFVHVSFFSKDFKGSEKRKALALFGGFSFFSPKKKARVGESGS